MTRYAIGDVQGCNDELRALIARLQFSADRDQLYFVGDLVNRGLDFTAPRLYILDGGKALTAAVRRHAGESAAMA